MTYSQKVDWRQALLVAAIFGMGAALLAGWTPLAPGTARMFGCLSLVMGVLAAWETAATRYEFTKNELVIHSGAMRHRIRYETIEAVRISRGWFSRLTSPNLVRLLVENRRSPGVVAICPRERDQFLSELTRAVPWLAVAER